MRRHSVLGMSEMPDRPAPTPLTREEIEQRFDTFIAGSTIVLRLDPSTIGRMVDHYQDGYTGQAFLMRSRPAELLDTMLMVFGYLLGQVDRPAA